LALDPKNGATLYNRGIALAEVGRDAEAIASFEAAVGIMQTEKGWCSLAEQLRCSTRAN